MWMNCKSWSAAGLAEQNEELQAELLGLQVREGRQLLAGQKETLPGCSLDSMSLQQVCAAETAALP